MKLILVALYLAVAAWAGGWSLLVLLAGVGLMLLAADIPLRILRNLFVTLLWFGLVTLAAHLVLGGSAGIGIPTAWGELISRVSHAARAWLRAVVAIGLLTGLTISTAPVEAAEALAGLFLTRKRGGRPGRRGSLVLTMVLVFRFYPLLAEEVLRLRRAREARGARLVGGGWRNSIREWGAVFTAFLGQTLRRADEVALALEARGYRG